MNKLTQIIESIKLSKEANQLFKWIRLRLILMMYSVEEIEYEIGMAEMPLIIFLLHLKLLRNPKLTLINNKTDVMISYNKSNIANMSYLAVNIHFLRFEKGMLTIEGTTSYPSIIVIQDTYANVNGQYISLDVYDANQDLKLGKKEYETRKAFKLKLKPEGYTQISFGNKLLDININYGRINSMRFSPIADVLQNQYYEKDGMVFRIERNSIICENASLAQVAICEKQFRKSIKRKYPLKTEWVIRLRDYFLKNKKHDKQIWLFMDRPDRADDNAKVLFRYVQDKKEIDSYFLLEEDSSDYKEMSGIGKVISIYSEEHYRLALTADYIISSQCNGLIENPFWDDAEFFRDLYHRPKIIFLQHGTIKDDMSPTLNRFNTNFTGFVTSTKDEYQSILNYPYHYTEKEVWLTGQPRYDELYDAREKIILFMPSWRKGLMKQVWNEEKQNMEWHMKADFSKSEFYKKYRAVFLDKKLIEICKAYGYRMVVCLHPLMREYTEQLVDGTMCESAAKGQAYKELFAKASLMVTDYSSVAFDFAYLKKAVIYYQFDRKKFFKEHTYKQGYFDYKKDGFGEVCENKKAMVNRLIQYIKNSCEPDINDRAKIDRTGFLNGNFCERVFEKIMHPEVG